MTPLFARFLKFNVVSSVGIGVQLAMLAVLVSGLHVHYIPATAAAVELAVLHNFIWHERYTWKGRGTGRARDVAIRLARFHLGNGFVSLAGNLVLMRLLVGVLGIQYLVANIVTIGACGLINFAISEWFVFR